MANETLINAKELTKYFVNQFCTDTLLYIDVIELSVLSLVAKYPVRVKWF